KILHASIKCLKEILQAEYQRSVLPPRNGFSSRRDSCFEKIPTVNHAIAVQPIEGVSVRLVGCGKIDCNKFGHVALPIWIGRNGIKSTHEGNCHHMSMVLQ